MHPNDPYCKSSPSNIKICEAVDCYEAATEAIAVSVGKFGAINLDLCHRCMVTKFQTHAKLLIHDSKEMKSRYSITTKSDCLSNAMNGMLTNKVRPSTTFQAAMRNTIVSFGKNSDSIEHAFVIGIEKGFKAIEIRDMMQVDDIFWIYPNRIGDKTCEEAFAEESS